MNTVRVLLEQEPSRLFLSLDEPSERERRRPSELRASSLAVRFRRRPFRRFARATLRHFRRHASGGSSPLRSPASFGSRVPMARPPPAHAARTCPCGVVCTALQSPHGTPPRLQIRKRGTVSRPPHGCISYSSNPATTVSSVLESNAFAASVTGR